MQAIKAFLCASGAGKYLPSILVIADSGMAADRYEYLEVPDVAHGQPGYLFLAQNRNGGSSGMLSHVAAIWVAQIQSLLCDAEDPAALLDAFLDESWQLCYSSDEECSDGSGDSSSEGEPADAGGASDDAGDDGDVSVERSDVSMADVSADGSDGEGSRSAVGGSASEDGDDDAMDVESEEHSGDDEDGPHVALYLDGDAASLEAFRTVLRWLENRRDPDQPGIMAVKLNAHRYGAVPA